MAKKKESAFEDKLDRLEEIVAGLEAGPATLDETLALFEEGVKLAREMEEVLAAAETRVRKLVRDENGGPEAVGEDEA
jgi:exodeoxyribonuclease VII small subunit